MALPRISDDSVLDAICGIAGGEHTCGDSREFARREMASRLRVKGLRSPNCVRHQMRPVVRRRSCNYAVVILRKSLCLHERLTPAVRTRLKIRILRSRAVKRRDNRLARDSGQMHRAIAEIANLLRMSKCAARIDSGCFVR